MTRTEDQIQRSMVEFLTRFVPPPMEGPAWTAVNPIPAKSKAAAGISKAMGLRPGVHDLVLCWGGRFVGIEIKTPTGVVSKNQERWHLDIAKTGGDTFIVRSLEEFIDVLDKIGVPMRGRIAA